MIFKESLEDKEYVADIVGARYDCHPEVAFRTLIGRSLITIDTENQNRLRMHDILRKMGREIIRQRSRNHPGNCSRIWLPKDAYNVLSKEMGTDAVEGLALDVQESFSTKSFTKMRHLKLLQIKGANLVGSYSLLPKELIWLCWFGCPLKSLPSDFHLNDLVILEMQYSNVRKLWKGTKILNKLKILNLSLFQRLVLLNLDYCDSLKTLPESMARYLKKLTKLSFGGYNKVFYSPDLPSKSWFSSWLSPQSCSVSLDMLPASFTSFSSLKELDLSYAGLAEATSSIDLGSLSFLENLNLSGHEFFNLPSSISRLSKLQFLTVERCRNLLSISELPSSVLFLSIYDCTSIERVTAPLQHERLPLLNVKGCRNLIEIQGIECAGNNWSILNLNRCNNLSENYKMSLIQGLCKGKHYDICLAGGEIPEWFSHRGEGSSLSFRLPSVSVADEKCGVHLIMEKNKADSDQEIDIHALGSDDQWLEKSERDRDIASQEGTHETYQHQLLLMSSGRVSDHIDELWKSLCFALLL
ncbi:disease resistance protein RML1A-like [Populus alba]|uniref:disease resistance protein RML1A-like n=1 Tax=Populus alba TaxID=43335 RepID=UPI003CC71E2F